MWVELTEKQIKKIKEKRIKQKKMQYRIMNSNISDEDKLIKLKWLFNTIWLYTKVYNYYEKLKCASNC